MSLLDKIKKVEDLKIVEYQPKGWDFPVHLKPMTATQREAYLDLALANSTKNTVKDTNATAVAFCLCEDDGTPVFKSVDAALAVLNKKNGSILADIKEQCEIVSGIGAPATVGK